MNGKQLKNSILQWAIQGKLVPQDPNDEPASVLLERIRAEKAKLVKEKKIKKDKNESIFTVVTIIPIMRSFSLPGRLSALMTRFRLRFRKGGNGVDSQVYTKHLLTVRIQHLITQNRVFLFCLSKDMSSGILRFNNTKIYI